MALIGTQLATVLVLQTVAHKHPHFVSFLASGCGVNWSSIMKQAINTSR
jgi:hypothetical protein